MIQDDHPRAESICSQGEDYDFFLFVVIDRTCIRFRIKDDHLVEVLFRLRQHPPVCPIRYFHVLRPEKISAHIAHLPIRNLPFPV